MLAARCPLGGLAVGHSEFWACEQLRQWISRRVERLMIDFKWSEAEVAIAMRWRCMSAFWKDWCSTFGAEHPKKSRTSSDYSFHPKDNPIFPATEEFFDAMSCRLRERGRWRTNWPQRNTLDFLWMGTKWILNDLHGNDSTTKHSRRLFVEKSLQLHWDSQLPLILRRKTKYATERGPWHGSDDLSLKTSNHAPD